MDREIYHKVVLTVCAATATLGLSLGCLQWTTFACARDGTRAEEKVWYEVQLGDEIRRIESDRVKPLTEKAELRLLNSDGEVQRRIEGGEIKYLLSEDGTKYSVGNKVETGSRLTPVCIESSTTLPGYWEDGYEFLGWVERDLSIVNAPESKFTFSGFVDLKPLLKGEMYTVRAGSTTFNVRFGGLANEIDVPEDNLTLIDGDRIETINTFNGYWFDGKQYFDGNGKAVRNWDIADNVILEESWKNVEKLPVADRAGYNFLGWSKSGSSADIGEMPKNGVLYAVFSPKTYYLNVMEEKVSVKYGEYARNVKVPQKFGYDFDGYYMEDESGETLIYDSQGECTVPWSWTKNGEAIEHWTKKTYSDTRTFRMNVGDSVKFEPDDDMTSIMCSNSRISATVSGSAVTIVGKKAGNAQCIVVEGGRNVLLDIQVLKKPTKITLGFKKKTLRVGKTIVLSPKVNAGSYSPYFTYKVSNSKVIKVSGGYLYAASKGKATVACQTSNGKKCKVTIKVVK